MQISAWTSGLEGWSCRTDPRTSCGTDRRDPRPGPDQIDGAVVLSEPHATAEARRRRLPSSAKAPSSHALDSHGARGSSTEQ